MAIGLSSLIRDLFPVALHVLAVDSDLGSLIALQKMLRRCSYQVTTCQRAEDALSLLRENNGQFDILLTEIQMPEMSGFQLLAETLKLPINLPVILFSADLDQDRTKAGLISGATFVLSKPISEDISKIIWQLACRYTNRFDLGRAGSVAPVVPIQGLEEERDNNLSVRNQEESFQNNSNITVAAIEKKKPRFSWTKERHNLFVEAVEFLGVDDAVPKKIFEYMQRRQEDTYLTRHVISSHLQKYRGKKAAKQGASGNTIQHTSSEIPPMGHTGTPSPYSIQIPTTSNIPPADSFSQSTYLNQGTNFAECSQMNEHESNNFRNSNVSLPSYALPQNAVGSAYSTREVPQPNQHLSSQDLVNQEPFDVDHTSVMINDVPHFPTDVEALENMCPGDDYLFIDQLFPGSEQLPDHMEWHPELVVQPYWPSSAL